MNIKKWFDLRSPDYIRQRAGILLDRYGVLPSKAKKRIETCVDELARFGCAPTFPTPGSVVRRYPGFLRGLQESGAEIAVHSYNHIDLRAIPPDAAARQLTRAISVFNSSGLESHGFRCPYLSWSEELLDALPEGTFAYSSNESIRWDEGDGGSNPQTAVFGILSEFYQPKNASDSICVPRRREKLVEIPVCVPDDLQYYDGLRMSAEEIGQAWIRILHKAHQRGELYDLVFHPELATQCMPAYRDLLEEARRLRPAVWIARLCEIGDWWNEKAGFAVQSFATAGGTHLSFSCTPRATILARGMDGLGDAASTWDGIYDRLTRSEVDLPGKRLPFVGLAADVAPRWVSFLEEQGYVLRVGDEAAKCSVVLESGILDESKSEVQVIEAIEGSTGPLVRFGRWPAGAKSAFSISGDLDALSLFDYASRLWNA